MELETEVIMPSIETRLSQLLDDFHSTESETSLDSHDRANKWQAMARRAVDAVISAQGDINRSKRDAAALEGRLTHLRSESDGWRQRYGDTEAYASHLSQQLRDAGMVPLTIRSSRGRSGSRPRSQSRERSSSRRGGMRRRGSNATAHVHWEDSARTASGEARVGAERQSRAYHMSPEELRQDRARRAEQEAREEFSTRKKNEFLEERDRLAQRFNRSSRGPSNVCFERVPWAPGPGMHPAGAPPPISRHEMPLPPDPLSNPGAIPPRADALPPEAFNFVMTGGRDMFGRRR